MRQDKIKTLQLRGTTFARRKDKSHSSSQPPVASANGSRLGNFTNSFLPRKLIELLPQSSSIAASKRSIFSRTTAPKSLRRKLRDKIFTTRMRKPSPLSYLVHHNHARGVVIAVEQRGGSDLAWRRNARCDCAPGRSAMVCWPRWSSRRARQKRPDHAPFEDGQIISARPATELASGTI
jgi:hypothetical protein